MTKAKAETGIVDSVIAEAADMANGTEAPADPILARIVQIEETLSALSDMVGSLVNVYHTMRDHLAHFFPGLRG